MLMLVDWAENTAAIFEKEICSAQVAMPLQFYKTIHAPVPRGFQRVLTSLLLAQFKCFRLPQNLRWHTVSCPWNRLPLRPIYRLTTELLQRRSKNVWVQTIFRGPARVLIAGCSCCSQWPSFRMEEATSHVFSVPPSPDDPRSCV